MSVKMLDTYYNVTDQAGAIKAAGIEVVGRYLSDGEGTIHQAFLPEEAAHYTAAGLKIVSIAEFGDPNTSAYFAAGSGNDNMVINRSLRFAKLVTQPLGTDIFVAVDYDAQILDVAAFLESTHNGIKDGGYLQSIYGSGLICQWAYEHGFAHRTWLAESSAWTGSKTWMSKADIVQTGTAKFAGYDVDYDLVVTPDVYWSLAA